MQLISVKINNIMSIEECQLDFESNGLVLVDGFNHDDNRFNGAGKSSIFNAISFCLYNKVPRKISSSEILRRGTKKGKVEVILENNGKQITITRGRPISVSIVVDGKDIDTDQEGVEKLIGLNYDQFLLSMYLSQTESKRLIELNDSSKKNTFLQLLSLDDISNYKDSANNKLLNIENKIQELDASLIKAETERSVLEENTTNKDEIQARLNDINIEDIKNKIKKINIEKKDVSSIDEMLSKLEDKLVKVGKLSNLRDNLRDKIVFLERSKPKKITSFTCPSCNSDIASGNGKLVTAESLEKERVSKTEEINKEIEDTNSKLNSLSNVDNKLLEIKDMISKLRNKRSNTLKEYDEKTRQLNNLNIEYNVQKSRKQDLINQLERIEKTNNQILSLSSSIENIKDNIKAEQENEALYKALKHVFSSTGVQAYILDSVIETFNSHVSQYIDLLWPSAQYVLTSYKENKSKKVVAKLSEILTMNGNQVSIGSLSGGEYRCLSLALDFAINDTLSNYLGISINPMILDEPFAGLDTVGRELVIDMLEKISKDRLIILVDHASEVKTRFDHVIKVEKRNGVSSVVL